MGQYALLQRTHVSTLTAGRKLGAKERGHETRSLSAVPAKHVLRAAPLTPDPPPPRADQAVRKLGEAKKLEGHLAYSADFGDGGKS